MGGKFVSLLRCTVSLTPILVGDLRKHVDVYAFGMTMFEVSHSASLSCSNPNVFPTEILTGKVPLGHIAYVDFILLVVDKDVRPERPDDDEPFAISDRVWSLAEACWAKYPQDRPTALAVCDIISTFTSSPVAVRQRNFTSTIVLQNDDMSISVAPSFSSILPRNSSIDNSYSALSLTSGTDTIEDKVVDDLGIVKSSRVIGSEPSPRRAPRWNRSTNIKDTSHIEMAYPSPPYTELPTGTSSSDRGSVAGKQITQGGSDKLAELDRHTVPNPWLRTPPMIDLISWPDNNRYADSLR
jgi:hypothetical protein